LLLEIKVVCIVHCAFVFLFLLCAYFFDVAPLFVLLLCFLQVTSLVQKGLLKRNIPTHAASSAAAAISFSGGTTARYSELQLQHLQYLCCVTMDMAEELSNSLHFKLRDFLYNNKGSMLL
jgi:hypothetical protein